MKSIYVRNLCKSYMQKKKRIIICFIVFVVIFGLFGVYQAYPDKISTSKSTEMKDYEDALEQYDTSIASIKENITTVQEQVNTQQKYCDESVFMKMDSSNVQVVSVQYMITLNDMNSSNADKNIAYILTAWTTYIGSGSFKSELADEVGNISTGYLSELITCATSGNTLTITVKHSDMEQAKLILDKIEKKIDEHTAVIKNNLGDFQMNVIDSSASAIVDVNVKNTQNSYLDTLRSYKNTLSDLQAKLVTQQAARKTYADQYKPAGVVTSSPKKVLVEYGALGVIAGLLIPFAVYALWYTISGKVKGKEELMASNLPVLAVYNQKTGFGERLEHLMLDFKLLAKTNNIDTICFSVLGKSDALAQTEKDLKDNLDQAELSGLYLNIEDENIKDLEKATDIGNIILIVEAGRTSYVDVEEQVEFGKRFGINIWGCIVIE